MARTRVIYQSEALFVADGTIPPTATHSSSTINQLHRVQSANYGFTINRQDVNQFGNLARIDQISIEAPTVNLDFSYFLGTGNNERNLGFSVGTGTNTAPFISGLIDSSVASNNISIISGRNFHILTVAEGNDANGSAAGVYNSASGARTIGIGNAYLTNYSLEAAVGGLPTVSVSCEGLNVNVVSGSVGVVPGIEVSAGTASTNTFTLPAPVSGSIGTTALRPGDISVIVADGVVAELPTGVEGTPFLNTSAHIQSVSIEAPIGRSTLERLGSTFGFTKVIDFPVEITVNMNALVADLKSSGAITTLLGSDTTKTLAFIFKTPGSQTERIVYEIRGAKLLSENFTSTIGDNKSVDLVFTSQIGGPQDTTNGLFVWTQNSAYTPSIA